jgi:hypothetical protein
MYLGSSRVEKNVTPAPKFWRVWMCSVCVPRGTGRSQSVVATSLGSKFRATQHPVDVGPRAAVQLVPNASHGSSFVELYVSNEFYLVTWRGSWWKTWFVAKSMDSSTHKIRLGTGKTVFWNVLSHVSWVKGDRDTLTVSKCWRGEGGHCKN